MSRSDVDAYIEKLETRVKRLSNLERRNAEQRDQARARVAQLENRVAAANAQLRIAGVDYKKAVTRIGEVARTSADRKARINAALKLHQSHRCDRPDCPCQEHPSECVVCEVPYPCKTVQALEGDQK